MLWRYLLSNFRFDQLFARITLVSSWVIYFIWSHSKRLYRRVRRFDDDVQPGAHQQQGFCQCMVVPQTEFHRFFYLFNCDWKNLKVFHSFPCVSRQHCTRPRGKEASQGMWSSKKMISTFLALFWHSHFLFLFTVSMSKAGWNSTSQKFFC